MTPLQVALRFINKASACGASTARSRYTRGMIALAADNPERALIELQLGLELYDAEARAAQGGGVIGDITTYSHTAATIEQHHLQTGMGHALAKLHQVDEGLVYLRAAFAAQPHDAAIGAALAGLLADSGRLGDGVAVLQGLVEVDPTNGGLWSNLGFALERLGLLEDAMQAYTQAVTLLPSHPQVITNYRNMRRRLAQPSPNPMPSVASRQPMHTAGPNGNGDTRSLQNQHAKAEVMAVSDDWRRILASRTKA